MAVNIKLIIIPKFVIERPNYDYAPSVMQDTDGLYKAWWCAGVAGDFIGYAESTEFRSGFKVFESKFFPNRSNGKPHTEISYTTFDGIHVCDPSVLKIGEKYYMYYGGLANHKISKKISGKKIRFTDYPQANSIATTYIGVAASEDGISWKRQNNRRPIIRPRGDPTKPKSYASFKSVYGAGQPSVVYLENIFYLVYHDSTGKASNKVNGAGIYVLSSTDPFFQEDVFELRCRGDQKQAIAAGECYETYWKPLAKKEQPSTKYAIMEAFSPEIAYSDSLKSFVIATHHQQNETRLNFFNPEFKRITEELLLINKGFDIPGGKWRDGPGLLTNHQGHIVTSSNSVFDCNSINIDVFSGSSLAKDPKSWDIAHWGVIMNNCTNPWFNPNINILYILLGFIAILLGTLSFSKFRS